MKSKILGLLTVALSQAIGAQASVVYDNGPPLEGGWEATTYRVADNFSILGGATIASVEIFLGGLGGDLSSWDGTLEYSFFEDNAATGVPGGLVSEPGASGNAVIKSVTDTGVPWKVGANDYRGNIFSILFELESPFAAAAGVKYWFSIHAASHYPNPGDGITWVSKGDGDRSAFAPLGTYNWDVWRFDLAFNLRSGTVPEPGTLALLGLGLAGLGLSRRRKG